MSRALRLGRRAATGISAAALAGAGLIVVASPAHAAACTSTASGVTVVVSGPGGTSVRCSPGDPGSGAAALSGAGFKVAQVQTQPGFVCRIDGAPASDPCVRTPPTTAYWSYWYAQPGGSWTYSSAGAYGRNPAPGSVEGWAFGAGGPPSVAPPSVSAPAPPPAPKPSTSAPKPAPKPAPAPAPKPSTSSSAAPRPSSASSSTPRSSAPAASSGSASGSTSAGSSAGSAAGSSAAPEGTSATTGTATTTDSPTDSPTESPTAGTAGTPSGEGSDGSASGDASAAGALPAEDAGSSSAAPTFAGLGIAGALLGAAGWMGWRRRAIT